MNDGIIWPGDVLTGASNLDLSPAPRRITGLGESR